ncbi:MAG: glycogen debranching protein GlgX [Candidatus Dactylopiibacterium sp.]|nr:glycogen debranching protein GlgX [Candidatus Dactylopiibacterium sp.]
MAELTPAFARDGSGAPCLAPGLPFPLGAQWDGRGVNFAVASEHAGRLFLCLFDARGETEIGRAEMPGRRDGIFHAYLPGAAPGLLYGFRAEGPWDPADGHFFNPCKLLLDPYAREIAGRFDWQGPHFAARRDDEAGADLADTTDNGASALKARVVDEAGFDWGDDRPPRVAPADTVLYELHVKGFSQRNPALPEALRGTYAGLAHPASIAHLQRLGVTSLSLLPVHYHVDEERLVGMGLVNYWGYNTLGFFCPDPRYASGEAGMSVRDEFRNMVIALHGAGIEVLLDVVYNHTCEGNGSGPTISFRGLDNANYYRLDPADRRNFINDTGCGNTFNLSHPAALRLVLDSLRFWVGEMHVDGFRFDLAPILGRHDDGFTPQHPFFTAIAQDPVLSRVKMIAEPWDIGPGGYRLGGFPRGWGEWNDRFRDNARGFWLADTATRGDFAMRLCGSSDLFQGSGRLPDASVNYLVSHDGFTLRDLVSYNARHNEANGENNRDGHAHNLSNNCGAEGPTDDADVLARRARLQRTLLATLLLAQGTPMLAAGDELGHTQGGNNNPYCQDNDITWIDWTQADDALIDYTATLLRLRRQALVFDNHWYSGLTDPRGLHDLAWCQPDGTPLEGDAWHDDASNAFACLVGQPGRALAPLLLLFNGAAEPVAFQLPAGVWTVQLDTADARGVGRWEGQGEVALEVGAHSLMLLSAAGAGIRL